MREFYVSVYQAVIRNDQGEEMDVDIGVVEKGVPFEAYWDSWIDERIYFNMTQQELDSLEVGDEIAEGDTLVEISREYRILKAEYDPAKYNEEEGIY